MKVTVGAVLFMRAKTGSPYPIAERHFGLLHIPKGHHPGTMPDGLSLYVPRYGSKYSQMREVL